MILNQELIIFWACTNKHIKICNLLPKIWVELIKYDQLGCTDAAPRLAHPRPTRRDAATWEGRRRPRVRAALCHVAIPESGRRGPTRLKSAPTRPKSGRLSSYRPYRPVSAESACIGRVRSKFKKKKKKVQNAPFDLT